MSTSILHFIKAVPIIIFLLPLHTYSREYTVPVNMVLEWSYVSTVSYGNPFRDVLVDVLVVAPGGRISSIPAFWAGDRVWKVRFSAQETGIYTFNTLCSDKGNTSLHNQTGSIRVTPYQGDNPLYAHGPLKISDIHRGFAHADGTPFLWLADSWWHGMTTRFRWPEDVQQLTADRKQKGFNVIQFAIGFPCDIAPFDRRGRNEAGDPWMDSTFTSINPAYFDHADLRIQHLVHEGMVPNILGAWGYYIKWMGADNMKAHWRYLIARYGAYPVIWTLSGETSLAYYSDLGEAWSHYRDVFRSQWSEVARYIKQTDPFQRLLTTHPGPGYMVDRMPPIYDIDVLDFIMVQSGHGGFNDLEKATRQLTEHLGQFPDKPVLHGEVNFEGMRSESWEDVQRFLFWSNMLMGAAGFSYGAEGIWQFNTPEELFGASPEGNVWGNVTWQTASHYRGSAQVGIGKRILDEFEWWKLRPDPDLLETDETGIFAPYAATMGENAVIVFLYNFPTRYRQTNITSLKGAYRVTMHDPVTGEAHDYGMITPDEQGRWQIPRTPVMQSWVVVLRAVGSVGEN
jgi:hypothetical protein